MQQRRSSNGRPSGTDGSDFSYRMVVDSRYQKVAKGRSRLRALIVFQAIIQIAGALYLGLQILKEEFPSSLTMASLVAGFLSVIVGEFGQRRSRAPLLRFYSFSTVVAMALSITVLAGGDLTLKDIKDVSILAATKKLEFLEAIRVLLGVPVQILAVKTALSLVSNMSPPKRSS